MLGEKEPDKWNKLARIMQSIARVPLMVFAITISGIVTWLLLIFAWRLAVMLYDRFLSEPWNWRW